MVQCPLSIPLISWSVSSLTRNPFALPPTLKLPQKIKRRAYVQLYFSIKNFFFNTNFSKLLIVNKFFTPHDFISLTTHTLSWILKKSLLNPKRAHIQTKKGQNSWFKLIAHHLIFLLIIQIHESHWKNFGSCDLEGQEVCSVKLQWFKVDKGKHVAWHIFSNSLNSDGAVCNR